MKYFTMTLALVAVLAVGSVSMADYTIGLAGGASVVVTQTQLDYGKCAYDLHVYGSKDFEGLAIMGAVNGGQTPPCEPTTELALVHQVWVGFASAPGETPFSDDCPGMFPVTICEYDTHFLFKASEITVPKALDPPLETNSMANENEIVLEGDDASYAHPGKGTFDTRQGMSDDPGVIPGVPLAFTFPGELDEDGYDLIHVVIECEDCVCLTGLYNIPGETDPRILSVPVGDCPCIPEPGTIVMLLAGALSFLGIRFRK